MNDPHTYREFNGYCSVGSVKNMVLWCEWLLKHGIEPTTVALHGWIQRDPQARRVWYLGLVLDRGLEDAPRTVTEMRHVQLESAPLPFPHPWPVAPSGRTETFVFESWLTEGALFHE